MKLLVIFLAFASFGVHASESASKTHAEYCYKTSLNLESSWSALQKSQRAVIEASEDVNNLIKDLPETEFVLRKEDYQNIVSLYDKFYRIWSNIYHISEMHAEDQKKYQASCFAIDVEPAIFSEICVEDTDWCRSLK